MKKSILLATAIALVYAGNTLSAANCELTSFTVETYDHGGVYLHGTLAGTPITFINLCTTNTNGQQDCTSVATSRRASVALAAQAAGKNLMVYYSGLSACPTTNPSYVQPTSITMLN